MWTQVYGACISGLDVPAEAQVYPPSNPLTCRPVDQGSKFGQKLMSALPANLSHGGQFNQELRSMPDKGMIYEVGTNTAVDG